MAALSLLTGITGQDGSYLAEQLLAVGDEVVGLVRDRRQQGLLTADSYERVTLIEADLGAHATLERALREVEPDRVYHLAAPTFVPASWDDPAGFLAQIAGATAVLLRTCAALRSSPRVFVATSAEVFGDAGISPQDERSPMHPRSPYGVAKLAAHQLVGLARKRDGLFAVSGLTFNHESPRRPQQFLPRKVTRAAAAIALGREHELVLGALDAVRDWSHAADIMTAARLALAAAEPNDYVLASGVGRTVAELVETAFEAAGLDQDRRRVRVDPAFVRPAEATPPVGDPTRARSLLGWQPQYTFSAMIAEMVAADMQILQAQ